MKPFKKIAVFLTFAILLASGTHLLAFAEELDSPSHAVFWGCGTITAPADSATIRFETLAVANSPQKAQKESLLQFEKLNTALEKYGTPEKLCSFTNEGMSGTHFLTTVNYELTTEDLQNAEEIIKILESLDISALFEICYTCKDTLALEKEALRLAVEDAQQKADSLGISLPISELRELGCFDTSFCCKPSERSNPTVTVECRVEIRYGSRHP